MVVTSEEILEGHRRYLEMPMYEDLCSVKGIDSDLTIEEFEQDPSKILISIGSFKSYPFELIMEDRYEELTKWLSSLTSEKIDTELPKLNSLDGWIRHIEENTGITPIHSSGTSGKMSLIPKSYSDLEIMEESVNYCLNDILGVKEGTPFFVMSFSEGNQALTKFFRMGAEASTKGNKEHQHFLFDRRITPELLRLRGGIYKNFGEKVKGWFMGKIQPMFYRKSMAKFKETLIGYEGQDIVLGGPPFMISDLVDKIIEEDGELQLGDRSMIISGGGWKSSGDQQIPREELIFRVRSTFGLDEWNIRDAYTMAEANWISIGCEYGNKHFSDRVKVGVLHEDGDNKDKLMHPLSTREGVYQGRLAFYAPNASYPSYIKTGDRVTVDFGGCDCGRPGPVFKSLIERCEGEEAEGCNPGLWRLMKR